MVDYRLFSVDQTNADTLLTMSSTETSQIDNWLVTGSLLAVLMLTAWLSSLKDLVFDQAQTTEQEDLDRRPNILLFVADDLGYNDSTLFNSSGIVTPSLESLAQSGARFTRHYADSTCTPSRVALLSGRYAERSGFRPVGTEIPAEFPTIAQQLQRAGYTTYLTGKWHAGEEREESQPQSKGFPNWFGFLNQWELSGEVTDDNKGGAKKPRYHDPMLRTNGGELTLHPGHLTDILTQHTIDKINEFDAKDAPWFIYHAFLAPHHPIQPAERFREQFPASPEGEYRALVSQMDESIGKILEAVDRDNTFVIFLSDNGGTNKQMDNNFPFHGKKGDALEGAYRTPLVLSWPRKVPANTRIDEIVMNVDIYPTILAAAGAPPEENIDGNNLWPTITANSPMPKRERSWEVYSENVGALNYSLLTADGDWRLSTSQGFTTQLYHLAAEPSGERDVAQEHEALLPRIKEKFWDMHWAKSHLAVREEKSQSGGATHYSGLDTLRSPFRYGSTIGIEVGPLNPESLTEHETLLAKQGELWRLVYRPGEGLEWHIGNAVLRDASFNPGACNPIVLTHFFEPMAHLAVREPRSRVKLYSHGILRDIDSNFDHLSMPFKDLATPTTVFHDGSANFYSMVVSSFADPYQPRIREQFLDIYTQLHRSRQLIFADVGYPTSMLCSSPSNPS